VTIVDYARVLKRGWAFVVTGLVLFVGTALAANVLLPREYASHVTIYISGQAAGDDAVAAAEVAHSRVLSYRKLLSDDRVLGDVVARLTLAETPAELADKIVVSNEPETLLIDVAVTDRSPEQAALIANTVADSFVRLAAELESCSASVASTPCLKPMGTSFPVVSAQVLTKAEPPTIQASPRPGLNLALGVLVGLVVGAVAAFVRNGLGRRVRSADHLRELLRVPNLGTFATDSAVRREPLLVPGDGNSPRSEELRRLVTNLRLIDISNPRKAVVLTSTRTGAGTTTTACNLAITLAAEGRQVALVDADLRRPGIAELLGVDPAIGLSTVLTGQVRLNRAMQSWGGRDCLDVLTTGDLPPSPSELLSSDQMSTVIKELRRRYDIVLFDSSPLLTAEDAAVLAAKVDGALLICPSSRTGSGEVTAAVNALEATAAKLLGTILTFTTRGRGVSSLRPPPPPPLLPGTPSEPPSEGLGPASAPAEKAGTHPGPVGAPVAAPASHLSALGSPRRPTPTPRPIPTPPPMSTPQATPPPRPTPPPTPAPRPT
jgi:capsular exopolysaccharide synthesis family protein